ncbi:MAG: MoaD family protein [Chloroflexi bacterium]|nr:MoaD family protein [Chloroflexota bacterium]
MPVIKLFANLRKFAGAKELSVMGSTVGGVLGALVGQNLQLRAAILVDGIPGPHVIITLNGHNIVDLNTAIDEQDVIAIFPPIAGGQGE